MQSTFSNVSIGVAVFRKTPPRLNEAIKLADALMYRVKNGGKNGILVEKFGSFEEIGQQPNVEALRKPRPTISEAPHP